MLPKDTLPTGLLITGSLITGLFGVTISFDVIVCPFILGTAAAFAPNVLSAILFSFEVFAWLLTIAASFPNARIGKNITGNKIIPATNPPLFPNLFAIPLYKTIIAYIFANGTHDNKTYHHSFSAISHIIYMLYIGIMDAQPGFPAFLNIFHNDTIIKILSAIDKIQKNNPIAAIAPVNPEVVDTPYEVPA